MAKTPAKSPASPEKRKALAKLHIEINNNGIDDASKRALYKRITNTSSAGKMQIGQIYKVIDEIIGKGGTTSTLPNNEVVKKLRALWISAYWLGVVENRSDHAIRAFVKRQIKVDHENWMTPQVAYKAIEALKAMLAREGKVQFIDDENPRIYIVRAQWEKLFWQDKVKSNASRFALDNWCDRNGYGMNHRYLDNETLDKLIVRFGKWLRKDI